MRLLLHSKQCDDWTDPSCCLLIDIIFTRTIVIKINNVIIKTFTRISVNSAKRKSILAMSWEIVPVRCACQQRRKLYKRALGNAPTRRKLGALAAFVSPVCAHQPSLVEGKELAQSLGFLSASLAVAFGMAGCLSQGVWGLFLQSVLTSFFHMVVLYCKRLLVFIIGCSTKPGVATTMKSERTAPRLEGANIIESWIAYKMPSPNLSMPGVSTICRSSYKA